MNRDELREVIRKQLTFTEENTIDNLMVLFDQQKNEVLDEVDRRLTSWLVESGGSIPIEIRKTIAELKQGKIDELPDGYVPQETGTTKSNTSPSVIYRTDWRSD